MKWLLIMIALLVISASTVAMVSESRQSPRERKTIVIRVTSSAIQMKSSHLLPLIYLKRKKAPSSQLSGKRHLR